MNGLLAKNVKLLRHLQSESKNLVNLADRKIKSVVVGDAVVPQT